MNKMDFVKRVAKKSGFNQNNARIAIDAVFAALEDLLKEDETFNQAGFGRFFTVTREERNARNPMTGETIHIGEKKSIRFKPSRALKEIVNK